MHEEAARPDGLPPEVALRRRHVERTLGALLLAALALPLARGWRHARATGAERTPVPVELEVDLARDPAWRLALLPGLGPRRALEIVRARERFGPPRTLEALERVPTIGPLTLSRLRQARSVRVLLAGRPVGCRHEP